MSDDERAVWELLGDPTRRRIVEQLAERPAAVGELAATLPVSRPAVSQHLKVLKDAGLVSERAEGVRRVYRVQPAALVALRDQLDTFWRRTLDGFAEAITETEHTEHADSEQTEPEHTRHHDQET